MSSERPGFICQCAEHGNTGFHRDEHETLVLIEDKLYELVASERTLDDLKDLSADVVPHVRHLNCIPNRTKAEQKAQKESSAHRVLEDARKVVKEKQAKEYEIQKEKAKVAAVGQPVVEKKPRESKCRKVVEELHKRAMTVKDMMMFEIAKSTAETFKYDLKRAGYKLEEGKIDGEVTLKILEDPVK